MSKKMMMLALAAVSAALLAMPAVASAEYWDLDNATNKTFTITQIEDATLEASNGDIVTCKKFTGEGKYTSETTGEITLDFSECQENTFGTDCGTIQVKNKVFHNVIIGNAADNKTPLGVLITGNSGGTSDFTTFTCAFGLLTVTVTGNIIGQIEDAKCGEEATTYNLKFEPKGSVGSETYTQKYEQITTEGPTYDLTADIPAGSSPGFTASQKGTGLIHLSGGVKATCS